MRNKKLNLVIQTKFKRPNFNDRLPILAKPLTGNYSLVGTAFDYLLRFYISKNKNVVNRSWVSESVGDLAKFDGDLRNTIDQTISNAKKAYKEYIEKGILTGDILKSVLELSKLDGIFRSGGVLPNSIDISSEDIDDLKKLYSIIPSNFFRTIKKCILNPTFGTASLMVGGADADLIIGDTLIDIKTTANLSFTKSYFLQLIGYLILNDIGGVDGVKNKIKIKKLGIYYSRYSYLFTFNISDMVNKKDFQKFRELFIDIAQGFE